MDKKLKNFIGLSVIIIAFFFLILMGFNYIYRHFTLIIYSNLLLTLIFATLILTLIFISAIAAVFYTYQSKKVKPICIWPLKIGLRFLFPMAFAIIGLFKGNKQGIRSFYISLNNIIVESRDVKYHPSDILVLMPHCLQFSGCEYKITRDIKNCRKCGKCCIGEISEITGRLGVFMVVATGGTTARNIVAERNPKIILSAACERDLLSGITEVGNIPVIGLINERPNGPCYNTLIDVGAFKEKLEGLVMS